MGNVYLIEDFGFELVNSYSVDTIKFIKGKLSLLCWWNNKGIWVYSGINIIEKLNSQDDLEAFLLNTYGL